MKEPTAEIESIARALARDALTGRRRPALDRRLAALVAGARGMRPGTPRRRQWVNIRIWIRPEAVDRIRERAGAAGLSFHAWCVRRLGGGAR